MSDQVCDSYVFRLFGVNPADYPPPSAAPSTAPASEAGQPPIDAPTSAPAGGHVPGFGTDPHAVNPYTPGPAPSPVRPDQIDTPYGPLLRSLPAHFPNAAKFKETTDRAVLADEDGLRGLRVMKKYMEDEAKAASFVKKNFDTLESEVGAHQNEAVKAIARHLGEHRQQLQFAYALLDSIKIQMESAQRSYDSAGMRVSGLSNSAEGARLLAEANARSSEIGTGMSLFGNLVELGAAVALDNPIGAIKPIYDIVSTVEQLAGHKHRTDKAETLQRTGTDQQIQSAYADMDNAEATMQAAAELAKKLKPALDETAKLLEETQGDAEHAYDDKAGKAAGFKFADLAGHLKWAEDGVSGAADLAANCEKASFAAGALAAEYKIASTGLKPDADEFTSLVSGMLAAQAMASAQQAAQREIESFGVRCRKMLAVLSDMRSRGDSRMVHAPVPKGH